MIDRYAEERLFKDILVPFNGSPQSWDAVRQALVVAARDQSQMHGLHIADKETFSPAIEVMQGQFDELCKAAGVQHGFLVERGEIAQKIYERALLADLVSAHPPMEGLPSLGSGLRKIIWRCARPLLTICGEPSPLNRAMLAFDGNPKAKEALFVSTSIWLSNGWQP